MVPRLALHLANLLNGVSNSLEVAAVATGSPVDDVELCDLLDLPRLGGRGGRRKRMEERGEGGREGGREKSGKGRGRKVIEVYYQNMQFVLVKFS